MKGKIFEKKKKNKKNNFVFLTTLWNWQHQGQIQAASIISRFYCDATYKFYRNKITTNIRNLQILQK